MYYKTRPYRIFYIANLLFLILLSLSCILPLIHVFAVSLSGNAAASANLVGLWPIDFTWDAYEKTVGNENFVNSLWVSAKRTLLGTGVGMLLIFMAAYALSKDDEKFPGRTAYTWFFVFTMLFNGGLVPNFILVVNLGLMNSIWALILPHAVNVWLMILMLNFFRNIPKELEEAAVMDGASQVRILFHIYLPLSLPAVATLSLFTMVFHWNSWFDGILYVNDNTKYPLATFLQTVIVQQDLSQLSLDPEDLENLSQRTVKSAQIFIGALPILLVYPFLQKYFVKGIVMGAVKE
jgi:putative aldouronate transport system permease protein